jgi:hypothetical protein
MQNELLAFMTQVTPVAEGDKFKVPICEAGTYELEYNDNDLNKRVSSGDIYTITFKNCTHNSTVYVAGGVTVAVGYASSPLPNFNDATSVVYAKNWTLGQSTTFKNFKMRSVNSSDFDMTTGLLDTSIVNSLDEGKNYALLNSNNLSHSAVVGGSTILHTYESLKFRYTTHIKDLTFKMQHEFKSTYQMNSTNLTIDTFSPVEFSGKLNALNDKTAPPSAGTVNLGVKNYVGTVLQAKPQGLSILLLGNPTAELRPWSKYGFR